MTAPSMSSRQGYLGTDGNVAATDMWDGGDSGDGGDSKILCIMVSRSQGNLTLLFRKRCNV